MPTRFRLLTRLLVATVAASLTTACGGTDSLTGIELEPKPDPCLQSIQAVVGNWAGMVGEARLTMVLSTKRVAVENFFFPGTHPEDALIFNGELDFEDDGLDTPFTATALCLGSPGYFDTRLQATRPTQRVVSVLRLTPLSREVLLVRLRPDLGSSEPILFSAEIHATLARQP